MLGGNGSVGYNTVEIFYMVHSNQSNPKIRSLGASLYPNISYFLLDNLSFGIASGLNLTYSKNISENTNQRSDRFTNVSLGPQIRYYFPYQRFAFFPQLQYLIGKDSNRREVLNPVTNLFETRRTNITNGQFQLGIGAAYFITPSVSVEGIFNYNSYHKIAETVVIGQFSDPFRYSFSFNLGMQFYLNKSKVK